MTLLTRCHSSIRIASRFAGAARRNLSSAAKRDLNEPIRFVGSPAASMTAKQARVAGMVNYDDVPSCQVYIVCGSLAIFLIYFCILREENDIDQELGRSLYDRVPGLEQTQLVLSYKFNLENNKDNTDVVNRMKELGMRLEDIK